MYTCSFVQPQNKSCSKSTFWSNNKGFCSAPRWPIQHTRVFAYSQNQKVLMDLETKTPTLTYIHTHNNILLESRFLVGLKYVKRKNQSNIIYLKL